MGPHSPLQLISDLYIYILLRHGWVIDLYTHPHFSYTNRRDIQEVFADCQGKENFN